jgi:predicted transcriptional regulator
MPVSEICVRDVIVAPRETPVQEAAHLMRQNHVGNLVVVDQRNGSHVPVGIVTDRDITVSVVATKLDPSVFTVGDLMGQELVVAREDQGIFETIRHRDRVGGRSDSAFGRGDE